MLPKRVVTLARSKGVIPRTTVGILATSRYWCVSRPGLFLARAMPHHISLRNLLLHSPLNPLCILTHHTYNMLFLTRYTFQGAHAPCPIPYNEIVKGYGVWTAFWAGVKCCD